MSDAKTYIDWIRTTLAEPRGIFSIHEVLRALRAGESHVLGAILPHEHVVAIATALVPELEAIVAKLPPPYVAPARIVHFRERTKAEEEAVYPRVAQLSVHQDPFDRGTSFAVGGLTSVGFAPGTELLLVMSTQGKGVFDCTTLTKVARDATATEELERWVATGIGPIAGISIPQSGTPYIGSPLPRVTPDGFSLGVIAPDHSSLRTLVWLTAPGENVEEPTFERAARLAKGFDDVRAAGFSASGRTLVVAEPHTLHLFRRR